MKKNMIPPQSHKLLSEYKKLFLVQVINHFFAVFVLLSIIHRKTRALPISKSHYETDNFTALLLHNDLFVDKSLLIKEFLEYDNSQFASTVVRPKGWGKSTNIHMLEKFFEIEVDENGNPLPKDKTINDKLFLGGTINLNSTATKNLKPLKIAAFSNITEQLGKRPVILLRLKNATGQNYEELERRIKVRVTEVFKRHDYLTRSSNITRKKEFEKYLAGDLNTSELRGSLHFLALKLKEHFGQEVFLLVDDYDVPLISAYREFKQGDHWRESAKAVELLRYILSAARKKSIDIPSDFILTTTENHVSSTAEASNSNNNSIDKSYISNITPYPSKNGTYTSNIVSGSIANVTIQNNTPHITNVSNIIPDLTKIITVQHITSIITTDPTTDTVYDSDISAIPPAEKRNAALLTGLLDLSFENPKTQISLEFDRVYTLYDEPFAKHYGFTHQEVRHLLTKISAPVDLDQMKLWYNGYNYKFLHQEQLQFYNPRSVIRCLLAPKFTFGYYGDEGDINKDGMIYNILSADNMQEDVQLLIASASQWVGGYTYMCSPVRWERSKIPDVLSDKRTLLIFHGLLGPCRPSPFHNGPNIGIPNKEARCVYETNMMRWVCKKFATNANDLHAFADLLATGFINQFGKRLRKYLSGASEFIKSSEYNAKISYGGLMMAVKKILIETGHQAEDVKENGAIRGINDILLVPKPFTSKIAFIIQYETAKEKNLTDEAEAKLEEINKWYCNGTVIEQRYPEVEKVFKLGIAFCEENVEIRYDISETTSNKTKTSSTTPQIGDFFLRRKIWKNSLISAKQIMKRQQHQQK